MFDILCVYVSHSVVSNSLSMDCSPPGSSVHGILQARILEWVAIPFSRGYSQPRDQTWVSCIADRFFTIWATRETLMFDINEHIWNYGKFNWEKKIGYAYLKYFFITKLAIHKYIKQLCLFENS